MKATPTTISPTSISTANAFALGTIESFKNVLYQCAAPWDLSLRSPASPDTNVPLAVFVIPDDSHS